MLKILQARLQQYVNWELPDSQAGFRKGRGTRDQTANIIRITEKTRQFKENIYFCFIDYAKAFDCVDNNKQWKILKEMGIPDDLTCLLRNLYAGQEVTGRTWHATIRIRSMDWFKIGRQRNCLTWYRCPDRETYLLDHNEVTEQEGCKYQGIFFFFLIRPMKGQIFFSHIRLAFWPTSNGLWLWCISTCLVKNLLKLKL